MKVLFVCSRNRRRSLTAERIFSQTPGWAVRSAGTEEGARVKVTAGHLGWADVIVVMEKRHKDRLRQNFAEAFSSKPCHCLFIPDDYDLMDPVLIAMLRENVRAHFPDIAYTGGPDMSEEIFDVVNERDEVVGQAPRSEVHRRKLNHRAVHVLVFNSRGELFLQKRSMKKDCFPGAWDSSASGHLDTGEEYDTCAVREVREELGVSLAETPRRLFRIEACPETGQEFLWVYHCEHDGPFALHPEEIESGGWYTPSQVSAWLEAKPEEFASALVLIWRRWLAEARRRGSN